MQHVDEREMDFAHITISDMRHLFEAMLRDRMDQSEMQITGGCRWEDDGSEFILMSNRQGAYIRIRFDTFDEEHAEQVCTEMGVAVVKLDMPPFMAQIVDDILRSMRN